MVIATSLVVLFYCCAIADILTKHLQQCFLFFDCCGYTWAIVRWAFIGPLVLLWFLDILSFNESWTLQFFKFDISELANLHSVLLLTSVPRYTPITD